MVSPGQKWVARDKRHVLAVALWEIHGLKVTASGLKLGAKTKKEANSIEGMITGMKLAASYVRMGVKREW